MSEEYKAIPSSVHRQRGRCCKSACIHCPYGHTLKKFGLTFMDIKSTEDKELNLFNELKIDLENFQISDYKLIYLKETLCGVMRKDNLFIRELELLEDFQDQGLDKPVIESYYFY